METFEEQLSKLLDKTEFSLFATSLANIADKRKQMCQNSNAPMSSSKWGIINKLAKQMKAEWIK